MGGIAMMKKKVTQNSGFTCEGMAPHMGRREILAGIAGVIAFSPAALADALRMKIADFATEEGAATGMARDRIGAEVTLRGYFAPATEPGVLFSLFEKPALPCSMCGGFHDSGANLRVIGESYPDGINMLRAIDVSGKIAVDDKGQAQLIARDVVIA